MSMEEKAAELRKRRAELLLGGGRPGLRSSTRPASSTPANGSIHSSDATAFRSNTASPSIAARSSAWRTRNCRPTAS